MTKKMASMTEREQKMMAEIERLQRHVDAAFHHACNGDAHAARLELTEARWGAWSSEMNAPLYQHGALSSDARQG